MAKLNNARKSDSWRPGMVANGSGMISKNQKRKEQRYSHNSSSLKSQDTAKKSLLGPLSKFKENLNRSLNLPGGKKQNKLLSTSLPIRGDTKSTSPKKNFKPAGILSNSNTPKAKGNKVTFNVDKKVDKLIDSEAEEGEEPVTDKVVKPYEKGSKQRQQLKRRMSMMGDEESGEESSDDESDDSATQFVDMEASEGEETDSVDEESDDEPSNDDFFTGDSDEVDDDSGEDVDSEDEEEESDGDEEQSEADEEEGSEDESEEEMATTNSGKVIAAPNRRESVAAVTLKKGKAESTPLPKKVAAEPAKKVDVKVDATPQSKKATVKIESEQKKVLVKGGTEPKTENAEALGKTQANVKNQSPEKVEKEKKVDETAVIGEKSLFVGFIRRIFNKVSLENVKSTLSEKIDAKKIVGLRLTRDRNVFVYLEDEDTLNSLLNETFVVNENFKFVVYKARESNSEKKPRYVAFLPKVPMAMTNAEIKDAIVEFMGTDCVEAVKFRRVFKGLQIRHVLVHFTDLESLKKMIQKELLQVGSNQLIIRPAFETTVEIPTYKILITSIPEKTTEAMLKKAIESQVGKNTVQIIQFSQKKSSFAFVTMKNAEAVKKALEVGSNISVNGNQIEVCEFKPHTPTKKRAAPSDQAEDEKKNKPKKRKLANDVASSAPKSGKKNKAKNASAKANVQKPPQQTPSKGAAAQSESKKEVPNSTGQQTAAKSKKKKRFPKPEKGANANEEPRNPVKGPNPNKSAKQNQKPQTPANGAAPAKGAKQNQKPQTPANGAAPAKGVKQNQKPQTQANGPAPAKGANQKQKPKNPANSPPAKGTDQKQEPPSPANGPASGQGANSKRQRKKLKKDSLNSQPQSPNPVNVSVNGISPSNPKRKKKNKNKQQQQQSPKPVDAKKQALVEKIALKKKNKKNSMKRDAS